MRPDETTRSALPRPAPESRRPGTRPAAPSSAPRTAFPWPARLRAPALLALAAALPVSAQPPHPERPPSLGDSLRVHEWGTFTTLAASSGRLLEGLYLDETRLPAFVHGLPFFNHGERGWPSRQALRGVTVKMETPVLYFYSDRERDVSVDVGFRGGTISQWFPQRTAGEANPPGPVVDLGAGPYAGSIAWKARLLPKASTHPFTAPAAQATGEWAAPRLTDANLLRGALDGQVEKFLFYRGLGHFPLAVTLRFLPDGRLEVRNGSPDTIPYVQVYDRTGSDNIGQPPRIWWEGPLLPRETRALARPPEPFYPQSAESMEKLHRAMVAAGLYGKEARALLNTWYNGYFIEGGLKAFWILPRRQVDALLPLAVSPKPDRIERVIIGRSEILTPAFEDSLAAEGGTLPSRAKDKYYYAYLDWLEHRGADPSPTAVAAPWRGASPRRPWRRVLPWEGPFAVPALGSASGAGGRALHDPAGRRLRR